MWTSAKAPSLTEIETMAREAFAGLPEKFRRLCEDLIIRVEDFPTDEVLNEMQADSWDCSRAQACRSRARMTLPGCPI